MWKEFTNKARKDDLVFHHWVQDKAGANEGMIYDVYLIFENGFNFINNLKQKLLLKNTTNPLKFQTLQKMNINNFL